MTSLTPAATSQSQAAATLASLHDAVTAYRTCEFATMSASGTPITWPAVCAVAPDGGSITLTTSIGLPRKALNIRRDPRVALLFSDPTGSGGTDLPQVLVRGTATCPEEIRTSPRGLEAYWQQLWTRQPGSPDVTSALGRAIFDFYYMRLVITVTPVEVTVRPPLRRPEGPHRPVENLPTSRPARGDHTPWAEAAGRAPAYPDGVLATVPNGEPPILRRVTVVPDASDRRFVLNAPAGERDDADVAAGTRASLLFHAHDERIDALRQFGVTGTARTDGGNVVLEPERFLPGSAPESPLAMARVLVRLRRTTRRYLQRRDLPRPRIAWDEFARLRDSRGLDGDGQAQG